MESEFLLETLSNFAPKHLESFECELHMKRAPVQSSIAFGQAPVHDCNLLGFLETLNRVVLV